MAWSADNYCLCGSGTTFKTISEIQIGGHKYSIELKDAATTDGDNNCGESWHQDQKILVCTKTLGGNVRKLNAVEETLLHECVHTADAIFNCHMSEDQVKQLSEGLYQILKQFGLELIKSV